MQAMMEAMEGRLLLCVTPAEQIPPAALSTTAPAIVAAVSTAPKITSAGSASFVVGTAGVFNIQTTGSPAVALSESGTLPAGVVYTDLGNGNGRIAGTPEFGTGGKYVISLKAKNGVRPTARQAFTLTVDQAAVISSTSGAVFTVGAAGSFTIMTDSEAFPAGAALTFTGTLPTGLSFLDSGDGTASISGTPATGTEKTYHLMIMSNNGVAASQAFNLAVADAPVFSSAASASVEIGSAINFDVTANATLTDVVSEIGTLPNGITFEGGTGLGILSGTPAVGTKGDYNIKFKVAYEFGVSPQVKQNFVLTVGKPPTIVAANTAEYLTGTMYSLPISTGGFPVAAISESGSLPPGMSFQDNGNGTATLAGTPDSVGVYVLDIKTKNGFLPTAKKTITVTVLAI
jgi:hypothetical protein